jgi:CheY-like chemotaxis protein
MLPFSSASLYTPGAGESASSYIRCGTVQTESVASFLQAVGRQDCSTGAFMAVRVFLVEDTKPMQQLIGDLLVSVGGYELVGSAAGETNATEWLQKNRGCWDLAIVDLLLAEGSGFTLISRCNKDAEGSGAVLVFSDFVSPAVQQRCKHLGADNVISKAHFSQLRSYLKSFLGRRPGMLPA